MYLVTSAIYEDMANLLLEEIGDTSYFSGFVESAFIDDLGQNVECRFVASLVVYRRDHSAPDGDTELISNIVPVWSEFHTFVEMEEKINDFDFEELKSYICRWN
ncbi:MAG: hypothetical protein SNH35_08790 [Rikenellaceae bacterium]